MAIDLNDAKLLDKVTQMGVFAYPLNVVLNMLDIPAVDSPAFSKAFNDPKSKVGLAYVRGRDKRLLQFESALMASAKKGNLEALRDLEARIKKREARK